jgi:hypothetical protein
MRKAGDLRLVRSEPDPQLPGRVHERFEQLYRNLPVWGADVTRQTAGDRTLTIFGTLYEDIRIGVTPTLSAAEAGRRAVQAAGTGAQPPEPPVLLIYPIEGQRYALAYMVRVRSAGDLARYFVDARDGVVLGRISDIRTGRSPGVS